MAVVWLQARLGLGFGDGNIIHCVRSGFRLGVFACGFACGLARLQLLKSLVWQAGLDGHDSLSASPLLPSSWFPHHTILLDTKTPPPQSPPSSSLSLSLPLPLPSGGAHQVRMDPDELRRVFQMFDRNGDGRITKHELNDSLENLGIFIADKELFNMIEKIDVNGDGCVDIDEFGELYQSIMDERDEEEDMKEAFNVFDQNGDGFITVDELRSVLSSLGLKQGRTIEECKRMIMKVDMDGDGRVNYKEFKQMLKGGGVYVAERHWRIEAGSVQPLQGGAPVKPMAWAYVVVDAFRNERGNICGTNLGKRGGGE
ncbi:hypothetical protein ACFX2I_013308 [Malus domestica]